MVTKPADSAARSPTSPEMIRSMNVLWFCRQDQYADESRCERRRTVRQAEECRRGTRPSARAAAGRGCCAAVGSVHIVLAALAIVSREDLAITARAGGTAAREVRTAAALPISTLAHNITLWNAEDVQQFAGRGRLLSHVLVLWKVEGGQPNATKRAEVWAKETQHYAAEASGLRAVMLTFPARGSVLQAAHFIGGLPALRGP